MIALIALIYGFLAVYFYKKNGAKYWYLAFSAAFLTSGFVYLAAVVVLISILYRELNSNSVSQRSILLTIAFGICILFLQIMASSYDANQLAIAQIIVLVFVLTNSKRIINPEVIRAIASGVLVGVLLIVANLLYNMGTAGIVIQDNFNHFSISGTFNYTGYYLVFGGILSPYILGYTSRVRWIFFILTLTTIFILENRGGFVLGIFLFYFINLGSKKIGLKPIIIAGVTLFLGAYTLINMGFVDPDDPNDIVYSILNLEGNSSNLERQDIILTVFDQLDKHPYGWGADQSTHALTYYGFNYPHTHNTLTQWAVEYGYFGLFLFLCLFLFLFITVVKGSKERRRVTFSLFIFIVLWMNFEAVQYNILVSIITVYYIFVLQFISVLPRLKHV